MLYFGVGPDRARKGAAILEVLRHTWGRLIHKQWLLFYPLALGVIGTIAFVAVYASSGRPSHVDHLLPGELPALGVIPRPSLYPASTFTPALGVAVAVGSGSACSRP